MPGLGRFLCGLLAAGLTGAKGAQTVQLAPAQDGQ